MNACCSPSGGCVNLPLSLGTLVAQSFSYSTYLRVYKKAWSLVMPEMGRESYSSTTSSHLLSPHPLPLSLPLSFPLSVSGCLSLAVEDLAQCPEEEEGVVSTTNGCQ